MIRPPLADGVAFSEASDGDLRSDPSARAALSGELGIPEDWAVVRQVHGDLVVRVDAAGSWGEADAMWTTASLLPLAVFTADCFGVVLAGSGAVGVAHAGWRGAAGGVVAGLRRAMEEAGHVPVAAAVGPGIGPCCFEVGPEVLARFPHYTATTGWGTPSTDLRSAIGEQLKGLRVWDSGRCTVHHPGWFSHRGSGTPERLAAIGWVP